MIELAHEKHRWVVKMWADGAYAGETEKRVKAATDITLEIVRRSSAASGDVWVQGDAEAPKSEGFRVLPWRWIVERTFGWLGRFRRLSKDYEESVESSAAWIRLALIWTLARRLAARR